MITMLAMGIVEGALSTTQFLVFGALFIVGLIGLGISALFGHDHDADHDADVGGDHEVDGHDTDGEGNAPSLLSPRIFLAFLTGFSVAGAIATAYGAKPGMATAIGFIPGMIMALIAWGIGYYLHSQQVNSNLRPGQAVGCEGVVVTSIRPGALGEVNVRVNGTLTPFTARAPVAIGEGEIVKVLSETGGTIVVGRKEFAT